MTENELKHALANVYDAINILDSTNLSSAVDLVGARGLLDGVDQRLDDLCDRIETFINDNKKEIK